MIHCDVGLYKLIYVDQKPHRCESTCGPIYIYFYWIFKLIIIIYLYNQTKRRRRRRSLLSKITQGIFMLLLNKEFNKQFEF